ncbi:MAG: hypothetical protein EXS00_00270 [Phycisphaerales bacterium]|nr:hypothetical protein [Phycisphaerales bacterium]
MSHEPHSPPPIEAAAGGHAHAAVHPAGDQPLVGHLVPMTTLVVTACALLVLTCITVAVRYMDIGEFNIYIALGIAVIKASLVALFFMHLRWDRPFNMIVFFGCVLFVVLMMGFCLMDTSQYRHEQINGNPPLVAETLLQNAPNAPVGRFDQ